MRPEFWSLKGTDKWFRGMSNEIHGTYIISNSLAKLRCISYCNLYLTEKHGEHQNQWGQAKVNEKICLNFQQETLKTDVKLRKFAKNWETHWEDKKADVKTKLWKFQHVFACIFMI